MRLAPVGGHDIRLRTKLFACRIVKLFNALIRDPAGREIGKQLLRSGTSVGAHIAEANYAKSRADFISKLDGALQELEETRYWIEILADSGLMKPKRLQAMLTEAGEIAAIITALVSKSRRQG